MLQAGHIAYTVAPVVVETIASRVIVMLIWAFIDKISCKAAFKLRLIAVLKTICAAVIKLGSDVTDITT